MVYFMSVGLSWGGGWSIAYGFVAADASEHLLRSTMQERPESSESSNFVAYHVQAMVNAVVLYGCGTFITRRHLNTEVQLLPCVAVSQMGSRSPSRLRYGIISQRTAQIRSRPVLVLLPPALICLCKWADTKPRGKDEPCC